MPEKARERERATPHKKKNRKFSWLDHNSQGRGTDRHPRFPFDAPHLAFRYNLSACSRSNWVLLLNRSAVRARMIGFLARDFFRGPSLSLAFFFTLSKTPDLSHRASTLDPSASLLDSSVTARIQTATRPFRPTTLRSPLTSWRPRRIEHRCRPWTAPSRTTMKSMVTRPSGSKM